MLYTRAQLIEQLEVDESILLELEKEEVIYADHSDRESGQFSELMLERGRVATVLIRDLGVNVEGVAIIVRMREEIADLQRELARLLGSQR